MNLNVCDEHDEYGVISAGESVVGAVRAPVTAAEMMNAMARCKYVDFQTAKTLKQRVRVSSVNKI